MPPGSGNANVIGMGNRDLINAFRLDLSCPVCSSEGSSAPLVELGGGEGTEEIWFVSDIVWYGSDQMSIIWSVVTLITYPNVSQLMQEEPEDIGPWLGIRTMGHLCHITFKMLL